jgi:hypothetical protein
LFFWLDERLYPGLASVEVTAPIFVMGHPRSGTTFFQKLIALTDEFSMFSTWQTIFPSVVQRKIARPFIALLRMFRMDVLQPASRGHEVRLDGVEEEEALFAHLLESDLVTYACPWLLLDETHSEAGLRLGHWDSETDTHGLIFFRECLRRHIFCTGRSRVVAKVNPMVFRLRAMTTVFPDARVVYLVRSPVKAVASFFSFIENFVGPLLSPEQTQLFFRRKYQWSVELYHHFELAKELIPERRRIAIPFNELTQHTETALHRFFDLAGITPAPAFWELLRNRLSTPHRRKHRTKPLSHFGFRPTEVAADLDFVMRRYLLPSPPVRRREGE